MADIIHGRVRATMDEDFVVFLIGMRINRFRRVREWFPVFTAMPRMLRELQAEPESGLLGSRFTPGIRNFTLVQYWRSAADLQAYAFDRDREHFPAWGEFNRKAAKSGAVGIWHETYPVSVDRYETIYNDMPAIGLGTVGDLVPARGSDLGRLTAEEPDVPTVPPEGEYDPEQGEQPRF